MKLNKFLWDIYKKSEQGQKTIDLFSDIDINVLLKKFGGELDIDYTNEIVCDLLEFVENPLFPEELELHEAENLFKNLIKSGFSIKYEDGEVFNFDAKNTDFLNLIPAFSIWLYLNYPDFFKPYFFRNNFYLLTRIADTFGLVLPKMPLKKDKEECILYYWRLCLTFNEFQESNDLSNEEFCAFLYDFAPNYIANSGEKNNELPKPTQVWMVGGNKQGGDFDFLDRNEKEEVSFWQGNVDTKRGDIIIMYCLFPRSYIHSIWRAVSDGVADPFFHYYSNIYIGKGIKITPVTLKDMKEDEYFSQNSLVRKNLQGVNGSPFSSVDYLNLQRLIARNGGIVQELPKLYSPIFKENENLINERDVEICLIEPFLLELGYKETDWKRQLSLRMGKGERNFPDYAFLTKNEKNYEEASMLIEAKYCINNNKELEETFKQVWSYGQRLMAKILVIADQNAVWVYERKNNSFDRSKYMKKYWKELENPENFKEIKLIIGHK